MILGIVALLVLTTSTFIWLQGYREVPEKSDAIVVLGAAVWPGGTPSTALYARTTRAIELYKQGYAPRLIFTGGVGANPPSEAEVMRQLALAQGVPLSAIVVEDQAHSTLESAERVEAICRSQGWSRVLIVSDPFHLVRARIVFQDHGLTASADPTRDSYYTPLTRGWYVMRETAALFSYLLGRPILDRV